MNAQTQFEPYVSPERAAEFLGFDGKCSRLKMIRMARAGELPAHPIGPENRRQWRFKLSELAEFMDGKLNLQPPSVRSADRSEQK
jgi:hypothetical protein